MSTDHTRGRATPESPGAGTDWADVPVAEVAQEFLAARRIAVTGVSRTPEGHGGNTIYRRLRERGYEVFAVNPAADHVEGDPCWPRVDAIPGGVDAVVAATRPDESVTTMRECVAAGVRQVWLHRAFGDGSVDRAAVAIGRDRGITVIDGGCPLMFPPASDLGHRFLRHVCGRKVPRRVPVRSERVEPPAPGTHEEDRR